MAAECRYATVTDGQKLARICCFTSGNEGRLLGSAHRRGNIDCIPQEYEAASNPGKHHRPRLIHLLARQDNDPTLSLEAFLYVSRIFIKLIVIRISEFGELP